MKLMKEAFQTLLGNTNDMVFVKNIDLIYEAASLPFARMVGKQSDLEIVGRTDFDIFEDQELADRYVTDDRALLASGKDLINYVEPITEEDGQARYGSTSKYILRNEKNEPLGILGITKDITWEYLTKQQYHREFKFLFELPENAYAVEYIDVEDWRIITERRKEINGASIQSCHSIEELCSVALQNIVPDEKEAINFYENFKPVVLKKIYEAGQRNLSFKYRRYMTDGSVRWIKNILRFLNDADTGHLCVMFSAKDIDTEIKEEQELKIAAKMDKMTMLLNRETTMEQIDTSMKEFPESNHALFMIDVDNFKTLNDTLGHLIGDKFLVLLSKEIQKCFRESDIKGRIGGDEFFVFMKNVPDVEIVKKKAENLLERIRVLCQNYPNLEISGSIGISIYPYGGRTLEELYRKADNALYLSKRNGKNQFHIV